MFENLLDPVFAPLLKLGVFWTVVILSIFVSLIITVIYKFMTDQNLMKQLKQEMKEFKKQMKELKSHPEKMMEVQKKAMRTNSKYMMQSMKSTLITFIPIILIFGWMNANIAYAPLLPDQEFTVGVTFKKSAFASGEIKLEVPEGIEFTGDRTKEIVNNKATWVLKGEAGEYINENAIKFTFNDNVEYKDLIITSEQRYVPPIKSVRNSPLKTIKVNHEPKRVVTLFGEFSFIGYKGGWLGTYIILSIITSILLRKVLKVY